MSVNDIKTMPLEERMQLMEAIWDSFVYGNATQSPEWHKDILKNRRTLLEKEEVKTYTLSELKQQR